MSSKLLKLEALVADLESAAGLNPDMEIIKQRDDGIWPAPQTDAPLIVERVNFKARPAEALKRANRKLAADVSVEREAFKAVARKAGRAK